MFAAKTLVLLIALISLQLELNHLPVAAQTPKTIAQTAEKPKSEAIAPEIKEKAVKLLSALNRESQQLAAPSNRVRIAALVGNLLWEFDESAARAIFQNALAELQNMFSNLHAPSNETAATADNANPYARRASLAELRKNYVLTLAERDPKAALLALQTLKAPLSNEDYDPLKIDGLELQIASIIAKKDPQQAFNLARQQLKNGIDYNLLTTLKDLFKRDPELGAKLAREILSTVKTWRITTPAAIRQELPENAEQNVGSSVDKTSLKPNNTIGFSDLIAFLSGVEELNRQALRTQDKKTLALTESEMRELIDLVVQSFLRDQDANHYSIASILPEITKYSPASLQLIKRKIGAAKSKEIDLISNSTSYYTQHDEKTPDELAALAESAPTSEERDSRYADAARVALEKDDAEKAVEIAARIKNKKSYDYFFTEIKTQTPLIKARRGDLQEVRKLLAAMNNDDEKVKTLAELIVALGQKNEKEAAGKLLAEVKSFAPARLKRKSNLDSALAIAVASASVEPEQAFALIENSIVQINDLIGAGVLINDFYDYGALENDELLYDTMEHQAAAHTPALVETVKKLAAADFERTINLADKFARPEIGTFVRFKIAEALLDAEAAEREKTLRQQYQNEREAD